MLFLRYAPSSRLAFTFRKTIYPYSFDEEIEVLDTLHSKAKQGHLVTVASIKAALECKASTTMSIQTVYNILYRHKWHKVVPDKVHPKNNPSSLEEFKKNPGCGTYGSHQRLPGGKELAHNVSRRSTFWTFARRPVSYTHLTLPTNREV